MTIQQATEILATMKFYGTAAGAKKGTWTLDLMTDVGKGNGFMRGRWQMETVETFRNYKDVLTKCEALNVEIAAQRKQAQEVLGIAA
jgi:hypothetical protein